MTTVERSTQLPSCEERPHSVVVIYDGQCSICTRQVERLARWDRRGRLSFLSLHDPQTAKRYPDLSHRDLMENMYVVDRQGNRHKGAAAFRELSRELPRLWWLAPILHVPGTMPLWQWCYQQVARRRYLFGRVEPCDSGACQTHLTRQ
jgi:predicted DCC family thiol-disulfide oxidoreductase YuxK